MLEALERGEAEVRIEKGKIDAVGLGALDGGEAIVGAPEVGELGRDCLGAVHEEETTAGWGFCRGRV